MRAPAISSFTCAVLLLGAGCAGDEVVNLMTEQDVIRKQMIATLKKIQTVLVDGYDLVARTSVTVASPYQTYSSVTVLQYDVPSDVSVARFSFQVEDVVLGQGVVGSCDSEEVIVHLKHGSYPAVNPDGFPFPSGFIEEAEREKIHTIKLKSHGDNQTHIIGNPRPGMWFAIVYLKWQPSTKIEQQDPSILPDEPKIDYQIGSLRCLVLYKITLLFFAPKVFRCIKSLAVECDAVMYSDLQVKRVDSLLIDCYSQIEMNVFVTPTAYKCMLTGNLTDLTVKIKIKQNSTDAKRAIVLMQGISFPSTEVNIVYCYIDLPMNDFQSITFQPQPFGFHYIVVEKAPENTDNITSCKSFDASPREAVQEYAVIDLMKENKGIFFNFDYNFPSEELEDTYNIIKMNSKKTYVLRFHLNPALDIGGTISLATSLLITLKYRMGFHRFPVDGTLLEFSEDEQFYKIVICQDLGHSSVPLANDSCLFNGAFKPALLVINSTDSVSINNIVFIPFPEGGVWYLSMRLFCDDTVCPCLVSKKDKTKYYVESDPSKAEEYRKTSGLSNDSRAGVSECDAILEFLLSSKPCVLGKCADRGSCLYVMSGTSVTSFCSCALGYAGWDCSFDARLESPLLLVLLLTLSNLFFVASIYVATVRKYYTEAAMYTFTMVFSTFYHACDAPATVSFCAVNKNLLQFGDFYCGIMSFWLTLLAMAVLRADVRSALQITGAIVVACLVSWNRKNITSFAIPVVGGMAVLIGTWAADYRRTRVWRYTRVYYVAYLPAGLTLVAIGLICFAFLQTDDNYRYLHSFWHATVAMSVACLLPDYKVPVKTPWTWRMGWRS